MSEAEERGDRAACFLLAMGTRVGPEVLVRMTPEAVRQALLQVARVTPDLGYSYLDPGLGPTTWLATHRALALHGPDEARRVADRLEGEGRADAVIEALDSLWEVSVRGPEARPGPVCEDLSSTDSLPPSGQGRESRKLAQVLAEEKPEGVALALALAPRSLGRRTLVDLVEIGRQDVLAWFAGLQHVYPGVLDPEEMGEDILSELLDGLRAEVRRRILERLREIDAGLVERLDARRFSIRELERLDEGGLGELMRTLPAEDLALALREAPQALRRRCLEAMPRGLRRLVINSLESEQPVRLRDVSRARERMGATYLQLRAAGGEGYAGAGL